jgi:hypothetical protein
MRKFGTYSVEEVDKLKKILDEFHIDYEVKIDDEFEVANELNIKDDLGYLRGATVVNDYLAFFIDDDELDKIPLTKYDELEDMRFFVKVDEPDFTYEDRPEPKRPENLAFDMGITIVLIPILIIFMIYYFMYLMN